MVAVDLVGNKETVEQTVKALGRPRARAAAERRGFTQRMKRAPPVLQNGFEIVSHVGPEVQRGVRSLGHAARALREAESHPAVAPTDKRHPINHNAFHSDIPHLVKHKFQQAAPPPHLTRESCEASELSAPSNSLPR